MQHNCPFDNCDHMDCKSYSYAVAKVWSLGRVLSGSLPPVELYSKVEIYNRKQKIPLLFLVHNHMRAENSSFETIPKVTIDYINYEQSKKPLLKGNERKNKSISKEK